MNVRPRRALAVNAGKFTGVASRILGRGGGTALPGTVATRVDPDLVGELAGQLAGGTAVVSGTNGKTTTSRLLAGILAGAGRSIVRNSSGSNLLRGVSAALVQRANVLGNLPAGAHAMGLFEVDEAALPGLLAALQPDTILLLNLFRDQLDRYGEVATVARLWSEALAGRAQGRVVANADDPLLAAAVGPDALYFGVEPNSSAGGTLEHAADVKACPCCGASIAYRSVTLGHLGDYACTQCAFRRPVPEVTARDVALRGVDGSTFCLEAGGRQAEVRLPLPGMYNVYNAVAAAAAAHALGIEPRATAASLRRATPAFGRMERVEVEGRDVIVALAKNPAGLNQVLTTAAQDPSPLHLLVLLNDNIADGRDVSWIWDADVEVLSGHLQSVVFAGTRGPDMALRFKYGGIIGAQAGAVWDLYPTTAEALARAIEVTPPGNRLYIIPTYTALLDVRNVLASQGHVRPYWEE